MAKDRHHPRERSAKKLARSAGTKPPYDRILIVCEGSKTEPLYFDDIRKLNRIPTAHVTVLPSELGTEPRQVVDHSLAVFLESRAYERVYAVFDRDDHRTYVDALKRAEELNGSLTNDNGETVVFEAIPTVPCFELWLLLHFEEVYAFAHRTEVVGKLKAHLPNYEKGLRGVYERTEGNVGVATQRAARLRGRFKAWGGTDPFTRVDELVDLLLNIRGTPPDRS